MSDASVDSKLKAIGDYEKIGLNCREQIHASLMRITAYSHAGQNEAAITEAKALFETWQLPALPRHFAHILVSLYLESDKPQQAEQYIDWLVNSRPAGLEGEPLLRVQLKQYVQQYMDAEAYSKAASLAQDLYLVRPHETFHRSDEQIHSIEKLHALLVLAGRQEQAASLRGRNAVLWIDRCPAIQYSTGYPFDCQGPIRLGEFTTSPEN